MDIKTAQSIQKLYNWCRFIVIIATMCLLYFALAAK
jgi:hypothetical protein